MVQCFCVRLINVFLITYRDTDNFTRPYSNPAALKRPELKSSNMHTLRACSANIMFLCDFLSIKIIETMTGASVLKTPTQIDA